MKSEKVVIVGAGLAGSMLGVLLARRGYEVELYERRSDMRKENISAGRSINLALSHRGLRALQKVGMDAYIKREVVPMKGRMVHMPDLSVNYQPYSAREEDYINSVSRGGLNKALMTNAEEYPNLKIFFNMKCIGYDFQNKEALFENTNDGSQIRVSGETFIGTDGSASALRDSMMNGGVRRFNFNQYYLDHGYKELSIPALEGGGFRLDESALHIWPRHDYMMIALPNFDGTFTCTLFMPYEGEHGLDNLDNKDKVVSFFREQFPDALPHMTNYLEEFFTNPTGALPTVKCFPWNVKGDVLLIGDSAHAIVPFYGQGMNCSFEDCIVLDECIDKFGGDWERVFTEYSILRKRNTDAIADLAHENYLEMRSSVANPTFVLKRQLEFEMERRYSDFNSKYSMVTFRTDIEYYIAKKKGEWQDNILMDYCSKFSSFEELNIEEAYKLVQNWKEN